MSWEKIFEMKDIKKTTKCSGCSKDKDKPCETVKEAKDCKELKPKVNASTNKTS